VIAPAGQRDEPQVALDHDGLRFRRDAGQAEAARHLALVHHPAERQVGVLGVVHHEAVEIAGVAQDQPHQLGVGDRVLAVGEGERAGLAQEADLGHLLAGEAFGERRHRMDVDDGRVARAPLDEIDQRDVVDRRLGVGHDDDGGDATGGGGAAAGRQRLAMLLARLAGEHLHVDQAGAQHMAGAVDHLGLGARALADMRPAVGDGVALDDEPAQLVAAR
jgi:hypothetical protein